jgi:hypothetical protein
MPPSRDAARAGVVESGPAGSGSSDHVTGWAIAKIGRRSKPRNEVIFTLILFLAIKTQIASRVEDLRDVEGVEHREEGEFIGGRVHDAEHVHIHFHADGGDHEVGVNVCRGDFGGARVVVVHAFGHEAVEEHPFAALVSVVTHDTDRCMTIGAEGRAERPEIASLASVIAAEVLRESKKEKDLVNLGKT